MKKKNMLMSFLILVCTLFFALPVQARTTEVSRVMNRKMSSAAYELGMRHVPSMNRRSSVNFYNRTVRSTRVTYAARGKYSSNCSYLQGETYYKNKAGRWNVCIRDRSLSLYGVKIGMTPANAYQRFTRYKWRRVWQGRTGCMYIKGSKVISMSVRNGKITNISYQWQMESEY